MKMVLNREWGGFRLPRDYAYTYGLKSPYDFDDDVIRKDERLIKWVQEHADSNGRCGDLEVMEIPDTCTDYEINEYDGWESITYVIDGKIHHV